jgi:hypothetical protein
MSSGWISLHRKLLDWEWYDDPNTMRLFIHCLLRANFESTKWRGHDIERGQFITSYAALSSELKLSPKQIRVALDKLKRTGEVASKSSSQHTVITVNNYLKYQDRGTLWGKQGANEGQTEGKRGATDNNNNKNNNENKTNGIASSEVILPDWLDKTLWNDWLELRKKNKAINSPNALNRILIKLNDIQSRLGLGNHAIEQSYLNGWKGIFEPKDKPKASDDPPRRSRRVMQ